MSENIEREHRFLLHVDPRIKLESFARKRFYIDQAYLINEERETLRVRYKADLINKQASFFTINSKVQIKNGDDEARYEREQPIKDLFLGDTILAFAKSLGSVVKKCRYVIGRWELDIFYGKHKGINFAEFERMPNEKFIPYGAFQQLPNGVHIIRDITNELNNAKLTRLSPQEINDYANECARGYLTIPSYL